jgi:hypothetical protein
MPAFLRVAKHELGIQKQVTTHAFCPNVLPCVLRAAWGGRLLDLVKGKSVRSLTVTHLAMLQALALRLAQHVRHICAGAI